MSEIAGGVEKDEERLEPERLLEPAIGGLRILIEDGARKPFGAVGVSHCALLWHARYSSKLEIFVRSSEHAQGAARCRELSSRYPPLPYAGRSRTQSASC